MRLAMVVRVEQQEALTASLFPRVEEWLQADPDHSAALLAAARRRGVTQARYRSLVDFAVCESFDYQRQAQRFYGGEGPALRDLISEDLRASYETGLLAALELSLRVYYHNRQSSQRRKRFAWAQFKGVARRFST